MTEYRLYYLENDRIVQGVDLDCASEAEAIEEAKRRDDGRRAMELWQRNRMVKRFDFIEPEKRRRQG